MNIIKENIDELNAVIKLQVEKEDYEKEYNSNISDYRRKATLKGFRPGKVPTGLIKKMYGKQIMAEAMNKIISQELPKYFEENKIEILGEPLTSKEQKQIDFEFQTEFEFCYDIGLKPQFDIKLSKDITLPFYDIAVENEVVDENIERILKQNSNEVEIDEITEEASVKGNFSQLDQEGNTLEGGITKEDVLLSINLIKDDEEKAKLIGGKKDDTVFFNIAKAFPNETEISSMLGIDKEIAKNLKSDFQYTISKIFTMKPAEANQELFDNIFGENNVNNEDEFKDKVRDDIEAQFPEMIEFKFKKDVQDYFLKELEINLPDEFLKRWLLETNKNITQEEIDKEYDRFKDNMKWQVVKSKISQEQKLEPDADDLKETAKQIALMQMRQYGIPNLPDEQLEPYVQQLLNDEKQKSQIMELAIEELVTDYVREEITLEVKEITTKDFDELLKSE